MTSGQPFVLQNCILAATHHVHCITTEHNGPAKKNQRKIVNIFLSIIFSICFKCSKEPSH